ncbi:uncharacterized protein LOC141633869 isoform X2 [Silene latifolia]|uniref:uncharacterized protein LOC141633869 isoform X2 n=1 Tax=Silene latifolia TaxID=37657 RepID=UPI003D77EBBF
MSKECFFINNCHLFRLRVARMLKGKFNLRFHFIVMNRRNTDFPVHHNRPSHFQLYAFSSESRNAGGRGDACSSFRGFCRRSTADGRYPAKSKWMHYQLICEAVLLSQEIS